MPGTGGTAGTWCIDTKHGTPSTMVCTARHGSGRRWMARWVDHQGKERTASYDRKVDAQKRINQVTAEIQTGGYVDPRMSVTTFGVVAEEWYTAIEQKLKASTSGGYRGLLDATILPRWGKVPLREIDYVSIQDWVVWLRTNPESRSRKPREGECAPLSPRRVVQVYGRMRQILDYAVRTQRLAANPAKNITLPRVRSKRDRALTHEDVAHLADSAGEMRPHMVMLAYTGLRFNEFTALRVGDVDLKRRRILVTKAIAPKRGGGLVEDTTKTHEDRVVPILTEELFTILQAATGGRDSSAYLFSGPAGGPLRNGYVRTRFDKAVAAAGLEDVTPKTLRHTAGSLALQSGASVVTVQRLLGHKHASTTMNIYSHMLPDDFDNLAVAMSKAVQAT